MTVTELIQELMDVPLNTEVMILDGFNGGGEPREINLGPSLRKITKKNAQESADCENKVGNTVLVIGYGCY
jgi:hypothetical protein